MPKQYFGQTPWDDRAIKILTNLWEAGWTATNIANELGGYGYSVTRNAVIGKVHRMGIKQPPRDISPKALRNQPRKRVIVPPDHAKADAWRRKVPTKKATQVQTQAFKQLDPTNPGISIMALNDQKCHAIVGRDAKGLATYCGEQVQQDRVDRSFCPAHYALYYTAPYRR